jgi:hypothetical protein
LFKKFFPPAAISSAVLPFASGNCRNNCLRQVQLSVLSTYLGLAAIYFSPAVLADQQSAADVDGYSLYQTSTVLGDKDVLLSSNALKVLDRKNGTGIIARAPEWKVYVINPRSKRICSYDMAKYPGIGKEVRSITGGISLGNLPLKRGEKSTVSSVAAISCETSKEFADKQQKDQERGFAGPRFVKWGQLMVANQGPLDKLPRQAKTILCRFYGVPEFSGQGLPLQFKYVDLADQLHTLLVTNTYKTTKLTPDTFDPPKNYTVVADMTKLDDRPKAKDNGPRPAEILRKGPFR